MFYTHKFCGQTGILSNQQTNILLTNEQIQGLLHPFSFTSQHKRSAAMNGVHLIN